MPESEEFEDVDEIDFSAPLDIRFVILGLAMMIFSLPILVFVENIQVKYLAFFCFLISFGVMVKKKKESILP